MKKSMVILAAIGAFSTSVLASDVFVNVGYNVAGSSETVIMGALFSEEEPLTLKSGGGGKPQDEGAPPAPGDTIQTVDSDAPAHEQLMAEVNNRLVWAAEQADVGMTLQSEYLYGMAQAEISSLRLSIDTILWLMGEGENFSEVIGFAPYKDWDAIVGAGPGSDAPFYFEGLLLTIQGKYTEAEECYKKAAANPMHTERDFFYLRYMTVEELYMLEEEVSALENTVYDLYTPRTRLLAERTGAEFSPYYHLAMAQELSDRPAEALQCAVNALMTNPMEPSLFSAAAAYAMDAGEADVACEYINEGLYIYPEDSALNYMAALLSAAAGDNATAQSYLNTAKANAEGELLEQINALAGQIGG